MSVLKIRTAAVFEPLLSPARYKGAWGGRGSGKSHFFAEQGIEHALAFPGDWGEGMRFACIRETQKSLKDSAKFLIEKKLSDFGLGEQQGFKVFRELIQTPGDGVITFDGMQDHTADSFKSKEGFHRLWGEEAHSLTDRSLTIIRPTIRANNSELWFSWNPARPTDAVDKLLRGPNTPTGSTVIRANWSDNPWFPKVLEQERLDCIEQTPERYGHIWNGEYATVLDGAYFAKHLTVAEQEGRICFLARDPLLKVYAFWDIGSSSDKADATAIWIVQFSGEEIRVLDYYEAVGQPFDAHVNWLRGAKYGDAVCILPHDGRKHDTVYSVTPQSALWDAGFEADVVPNQGRGAALMRIDALRRVFQNIKFERDKTQGGRDALGWYHEKKDEHRNIGLGPDHDWSSHAADAMGLMAIWRLANPSNSWGSGGAIKRNIKGFR